MIVKTHLSLLFALVISLAGYNAIAQQLDERINYSCKNASLISVLNQVKLQCGNALFFSFKQEDFIDAKPVTIDAINMPLLDFLNSIFWGQPLCYKYQHSAVIIKRKNLLQKENYKDSVIRKILTGKITDIHILPIEGASISCGGQIINITDADGIFSIPAFRQAETLVISCRGYETRTYKVKDEDFKLTLLKQVVKIPEVEVTHKIDKNAESTGNTTTIIYADTAKQGGKDMLRELASLVPGLSYTAANGAYGGLTEIVLRGRSWVPQNGSVNSPFNGPLFFYDDIPLLSPNHPVNLLTSAVGNPNLNGTALGGLSIARFFNSDDVNSLQVVKDADATAIYGSRGANGAIRITTGKLSDSKPGLSVNIYGGVVSAPVYSKLMNADQYISARTQGLKNDNLQVSSTSAPDLEMNGNNNKNYNDVFLGNTAEMINIHLSYNGGNDTFRYRLNFGYYNERNILPGDMVKKQFYDKDIFFHLTTQQNSKNQKFTSTQVGLFTIGKSVSISTDNPMQAALFFPNAPNPTDDKGNLNWYPGIVNPGSLLKSGYVADIRNGLFNVKSTYRPLTRLQINASLGIHLIDVQEHAIFPIAATDPAIMTTGSADFASNMVKNFIAELSAEYKSKPKKRFNYSFSSGTTALRQSGTKQIISATGYTNDDLLSSPNAAPDYISTRASSEYRYVSIYTRAGFSYDKKIILNLTAVRDGSSRYGPTTRFGNFYTIAGAWLFSKEFFKNSDVLELAKIRASYGITGNDQIGDYVHNDIWVPVNSQRNYGGSRALTPGGHFNENYTWELCKKMEVALEWKLFNGWGISLIYYHHLSTNQATTQVVTAQTGFSSIRGININAKVRNQGLEWTLEKKNATEGRKIKWTLLFIGTIPSNTLLSFPGLAQSIYEGRLVEGEPLSVQQGFRYLRVNSQSGLYEVDDKDHNGKFNNADYIVIGNMEPKFYGGITGSVNYKRFTLNCNWEFRFQQGVNQILLFDPGKFTANGYSNLPVDFENHWRFPGDITPIVRRPCFCSLTGTCISKE